MSVAGMSKWSLRLEQVEGSRLAWAFGVSMAVHLLLFGTYFAGKKYGWWQQLQWPAWVKTPVLITEMLKKKPPNAEQPQVQEQIPLMFVDVSPSQAVADAPKNAKYYSDKNALAGNPNPDVDTGVPRIEGKQQDIVRTEDVPRETYKPLVPAPPVAEVNQAPLPQEELRPKPTLTPGDLAFAKPEPEPVKDPKNPGDAPKARPRTIKEALAQKRTTRLPGEKMRSEGGVSRRLDVGGVDVKATGFGAYDSEFISAVANCWYQALDQIVYASNSRCKVVLQFTLHYDGRVTGMNVAESGCGEMLTIVCQRAVLTPAPFREWPMEMRRVLGEKRNIQFTFYYN